MLAAAPVPYSDLLEIRSFLSSHDAASRASAARRCQELIEQGADDSELWCLAGYSFAQLSPVRSLACFQRAISLDPENIENRLAAADLLENNGETHRAIAFLLQAIDELGDRAEFLVRLAAYRIRVNQIVEAKHCIERIAALNPRDVHLPDLIRRLEKRLGQKAEGELLDGDWYRERYGSRAYFYPSKDALRTSSSIVEHFIGALAPNNPILHSAGRVFSIGSCFAANVVDYLRKRGYVAQLLGQHDTFINVHSIAQLFEEAKRSGQVSQDAATVRHLLSDADVCIVTFGLSEVWYELETGVVLRHAPREWDPNRYAFRVCSVAETTGRIADILRLIREINPRVNIVLTLSPVPLTATFRPIPAIVADSASKAILRAALDEVLRDSEDGGVYYFPAYEIATRYFMEPYQPDNRHVTMEVIDAIMNSFYDVYCASE